MIYTKGNYKNQILTYIFYSFAGVRFYCNQMQKASKCRLYLSEVPIKPLIAEDYESCALTS